MTFSSFVSALSVYLQEVLHDFDQAILFPVILILACLIIFAIWSVGSVIVETFTERRRVTASVPDLINALHAAPFDKLNDVICEGGILWTQKRALLMVANNAGLPSDALYSLAKAEICRVDEIYRKRVGRTDLLTKAAPMMGLMATLIPLGPGIVAMGQGDVNTLSNSLAIAFDCTVAGLVSAVVSMVVSHIRKRWYNAYLMSLESLMTTLLERAQAEREAGSDLPCGFSEADLAPFRERAKAAVQAGGARNGAGAKGAAGGKGGACVTGTRKGAPGGKGAQVTATRPVGVSHPSEHSASGAPSAEGSVK
jgi:biopolymer transport protein ExbB/TolQ